MKIGITASAFDFCHAGHLMMLKEAKENCDYLICALHINPSFENSNKNRPVETCSERYLRLESCKYVDQIIPYETEKELRELLLFIGPDIRFLGSDYMNKNFTGKDIPNIQIYYCIRTHSLSSTELKERIIKNRNIYLRDI